MGKQPKPLGVYVHIPFCVKKCGYCDFLSFENKEGSYDKYLEALICEIGQTDLSEYYVSSLYIGGGTPTVLEPKKLGLILRQFDIQEHSEVTVEANPNTVSCESLSELREYGFNRISFGFQSNNNRLLKLIGRIHDCKTFEGNFYEARRAGFENINVDIMFALPEQSLKDWQNTLDFVIEKAPEHVSAYGLILEKGTRLYKEAKHLKMPDEDQYLEMYYAAKEGLKAAGYEHYEISNFAKPGFSSKHNKTYWRCNEYAAFGLGASSYIGAVRSRNGNELGKYLDKRFEKFDVEKIEGSTEISEFMFMGLRMMEGISLSEFYGKFKRTVSEVYGNTVSDLIKKGLLVQSGDRIYLSERGIDISNYVFSEFML